MPSARADHDRQQQGPRRRDRARRRRCSISSPVLTRSIQLTTTSLSGGSAEVETRPSRATTSHSTASSTQRQIAEPDRLHGAAVPLRLDRLVAHQVPELVDLVDEALGLEHAGIVLVELGVDDGLDAAGPRRHHRDAVGEIDRLLHVVGDEDHGLRRALPDAEQLRLHQVPGLRVERAERLVHQQDARIEGERAGERGALLHAAGELRRDSCPRSR